MSNLQKAFQEIGKDIKLLKQQKSQAAQEGSSLPRVVVLNDYLPNDIQEQVVTDNPETQEIDIVQEIQKAWDEHVKPGDHVILHGKFPVTKHVGYKPEIYGQDNVEVEIKQGTQLLFKTKKYGQQPCLSFLMDNNTLDLSNATFIVDKLFQDIIQVRAYRGVNRIIGGKFFTKAILDLDPTGQAANDWKGTLGCDGKVGIWPRKDKETGASIKGTKTDGFDTTTAPYELSNHRNNSIDTSNFNFGGYLNNTNKHAFPQSTGVNDTSETWGTWYDGWIGNWGSALVIMQSPEVSLEDKKLAEIHVDNLYGRGFRSYTVEIGNGAKHDGTPLPRYGDETVMPYVPQNVYLNHIVAEDNYEGGIQLWRGINIWEMYSRVNRMGHPDWSLTDHRDKDETAPQVDPGYGSSSQRTSPQIQRHIIGGVYKNCARKGIDAHHGADVYIDNVEIDAGLWGIEVALEENQSNWKEDSVLNNYFNKFTVKNSTIRSGFYGIDFINGAFSAKVWKDKVDGKVLNGLRVDILVDNNVVMAPFGWRDNYGRGEMVVSNNTFIGALSHPIHSGFNTSKFRGIWTGSGFAARNGIPYWNIFSNNKVMNSPTLNYATGVFIEESNILLMDNTIVDVTPYTNDSINGVKYEFGAVNCIRSGVETAPLVYSKAETATKPNVKLNNFFSFSRLKDKVVNHSNTAAGAPATPGEKAKTEEEQKKEEQANTPQAAPEAPKETLAKIEFSFEGATVDRTVSVDGKSPIKFISKIAPKDGFSDFVNTTASPRYISAHLSTTGASSGVYPAIEGINTLEATTPSTIIMPIMVEHFGSRPTNYLFSAADESYGGNGITGILLAVRSDVGKEDKQVGGKTETVYKNFTFQNNVGVQVNGTAVPNKTQTYPMNTWMILVYRGMIKAKHLALLSRYDGNGMVSGKIGEGLQVYPGKSLSDEELGKIVTELKTKYGIS